MKKLFLSLSILALSFTMKAQTQINKGPLDGQAFTTTITEDGKKKPLDPDDIKFQGGKFRSSLFVDWGYTKAGKYEITNIDSTTNTSEKIYAWTVELANEEGEKLVWSGTITADDIEGSIEQLNKKGIPKKNYTFTGVLKKKPGQKK